jgi:hypothetical protein
MKRWPPAPFGITSSRSPNGWNGIVKLTAQRKNTFHSAGISSGSEALTSHLGRENGLELTLTSHATTLF